MKMVIANARLSLEELTLLQGYADGELSGQDAANADALMATKPDAQAFVLQTLALGDLVRENAASVSALHTHHELELIMSKVFADAAPRVAEEALAGATLPVGNLDDRATGARHSEFGKRPTLVSIPTPTPAAAKRSRRNMVVLGEESALMAFPVHLRWGLVAAAALAAAAALTFVLEKPKIPSELANIGSNVGSNLGASLGAGVSIEHLESQSGVSLFYVPATTATDSASVVVWLDDDSPGASVTAEQPASVVPALSFGDTGKTAAPVLVPTIAAPFLPRSAGAKP